MKAPIRIALVGCGKIARDQHAPAIEASPRFELAFGVDPAGGEIAGAPIYSDLSAAFGSGQTVEAVAICAPPAAHVTLARACLTAGLHTLVEKPPAVSVAEASPLANHAGASGAALFAAWHSRFAAKVEAAAAWTANRTLTSVEIEWREDAEVWHPGQDWLWRAGGFGVFDPGVNAFSILTRLVRAPMSVAASHLVFEPGAQTPAAARLDLTCGPAQGRADLDFRWSGHPVWRIGLRASSGERLELSRGGRTLRIDDAAPEHGADVEYAGVYARFADLIEARAIDWDLAPLGLAETALRLGGAERLPSPGE